MLECNARREARPDCSWPWRVRKIEVDFCTEVSCLKFHLKVRLLCAGRGLRGFLMKGDLVLVDEKN